VTGDFAARVLGVVAAAALFQFFAATLLLDALPQATVPGQRAALSLGLLLTTLSAVAVLYVRVQYSSEQHVARSVPAVFVLAPPILVLVLVPLTLPASLLSQGVRVLVDVSTPVLVAAWAPGLLVAMILDRVLRALASRTPADDGVFVLRTFDPPSLAQSFGRTLVLCALAAILLAFGVAAPTPEEAFPVVQSVLAWVGAGCLIALAGVIGWSLGQSPGEAVVSIATRLDAVGYGPKHDALDSPVIATSPDQIGELLATLEVLRKRLVSEMGLYEQALEKTKTADNLKAEFLSAVSHELRTPLNAVSGFAQLLLESRPSELTEAQAEDLRLIQAGARQLLGLINDILDMSMIESGELRLSYGPTEIAVTIHEVVRSHQPLVRGSDVVLTAEIEPELPPVVCDERRLTQILTNLVSNAVKFTERGKITVKAVYEPRLNGVAIHCIDTGIGIEAHHLSEIFEEYRQVGSGGKRRARGTGLGLAIARRIASAHGGSLTVESVPHEGSTFTLSLPLDPPNRPATIDMVEEVARYRAEASALGRVPSKEHR